MRATQPWTCPTCKHPVNTLFCPGCGEKQIQKHDLTLRGLLEQVLHMFSHVDGRVISSFRHLLARPGTLTLAFQNGQRKPFIGPFQIFLITNVIFFAVQSSSNMKIFSNTLEFRLHGQLLSDYGQTLVTDRLAATGLSFSQYAPVFNEAVAVNAKSLIGLMVPVLALFLPLLFWKAARPMAVHVVFALHFYAFVLVLFCLPLALMAINGVFGGDGVMKQSSDDITSIIMLLSCAAYLYVAIGPAYAAKGVTRVIQAMLLTVAAVLIFFAYRFALLPITLFTT